MTTRNMTYMQIRRAAAIARGDCPVCCKRPKLAHAVRCAQCNDAQRERNRASYAGAAPYVPLEEILATPRARILRAVRWLDWFTPITLLDLLDVPLDDRPRYRQALAGATQHGLIQRREVYGVGEYLITARGKDALRRLNSNYELRLGEGVAA